MGKFRQTGQFVRRPEQLRRTLRQAETEGGFTQLPILDAPPGVLEDGYVWLQRFGGSIQLMVAVDGGIKLLAATP